MKSESSRARVTRANSSISCQTGREATEGFAAWRDRQLTLRQDGIAPPHWEKPFFDHLLRSAESYTEKWHYVRENPVRAGLVSKSEDWRFGGEVFPLEYRSER